MCIGVVRGCSGCTCTPWAEKNFRRNLQGKFVSTPPGSESQFLGHSLLGGGDMEGRSGSFSSFSIVLACILRATTKKGGQLF